MYRFPRYITLAVLAALLVLMTGMLSGCTNKDTQAKALTINDIQMDPLSFTGEITITGVNAGHYPADSSVFFIVDTAELLLCKDLSCGAFQLPVVYKGSDPLPELADELNITGSWGKYEIEDQNGTQSVDIFEITKLDVKRNIMKLLR